MNPVRKLIQKIGFDLHRHQPTPSKLAWLVDRQIRTVLDIGANVGQFAKEIREELPEVQIYSFEPIKESFEKLNKNMKADKKFKAFNFALGEKDGEVIMNKSSYTPSSSLLQMAESHKTLFPHTREQTQEKIKVRTLDVIAEELDLQKEILIKVDVQGFEDKVIRGGIATFKQARAVLIEASFVELYLGQPLFDDIYQIFIELGFKYKGALHEKLNPKSGEILFEDAIFVRNEK